jgi:transposase-like protein
MMAGMSTRSSTRERWRRIIERQQAGGRSVAAFCRRAGVPPSSFYAWQRRLRTTDPSGSDAADFVEVQRPAPPGAEPSAIELCLSHHRAILVRPGFDRQTLLELVHALEASISGLGRGEAGP